MLFEPENMLSFISELRWYYNTSNQYIKILVLEEKHKKNLQQNK